MPSPGSLARSPPARCGCRRRRLTCAATGSGRPGSACGFRSRGPPGHRHLADVSVVAVERQHRRDPGRDRRLRRPPGRLAGRKARHPGWFPRPQRRHKRDEERQAHLVPGHTGRGQVYPCTWPAIPPHRGHGTGPPDVRARTTITSSRSITSSMTRDDNPENTIPTRSLMPHLADHATQTYRDIGDTPSPPKVRQSRK